MYTCAAELKQAENKLTDSFANYKTIKKTYSAQRSEMGAEGDEVRSEIQNVRLRSQENGAFQRVRDARIEAEEQFRNVHTRRKALDEARKRYRMAKAKKSKLHEREVEFAKEVHDCMLHTLHWVMAWHKASFYVTLGTRIAYKKMYL